MWKTKDREVATAAMVEAGRVEVNLATLIGRLGPLFARPQPLRQAGNHVRGLMSDLPRKNCWTLAEYAGDPTSDRMQRLLERAFASLAARIMVLLLPVVSPSRPAHLILDRIKTTSSSKALYADLETSLNISGPFGAASPGG